MEITKSKLQMARDSILGLAASFLIQGIIKTLMSTAGSEFLIIAYLGSAVIMATLLLLPRRLRLGTHVALFLLLSFALISIHPITQARGHILLIFTTLIWCQYGIPRGHKIFVLLGLAALWISAMVVSGAGYIEQPPLETTIRIRRLQALQHILLYIGAAWQLWVIVVRPQKQLRAQYDRKIEHLNEIAARYRCLIRDRVIRPNEPGPDRARMLDIVIELMSDARIEGMMTKEELSFLHNVLEDCRREYGQASLRMNAAISEARHLLEGGLEPRSRSE